MLDGLWTSPSFLVTGEGSEVQGRARCPGHTVVGGSDRITGVLGPHPVLTSMAPGVTPQTRWDSYSRAGSGGITGAWGAGRRWCWISQRLQVAPSVTLTLAGALHRKGPNRAQPPLVVMSADFIQLKGQGGGGFGWDRLSSPRTHAAHARSRTHAHTRRSTLPPYPVGTST